MAWFRSLQGKFITCFLVLLLIPMAEVALYGHFFTRNMLSAEALQQSYQEVNLQADTIETSMQQAHGDALYLAGLRSLGMLRQQSDAAQIALWREEVVQDFLVFSSVRPMYRTLRYIDANGQEVLGVISDGMRVTALTTLINRSESSFFQRVMEQPPGGSYVTSFALEQEAEDEGSPFIYYALRLADGEGLIVIDVHVGWLLRALPGRPVSDIWAMVDQDGRYLVYPQGFDPATRKDIIPDLLMRLRGNLETDESVFLFDTIYPVSSHAQSWLLYRETPKEVFYGAVSRFYLGAFLFIAGAILLAILLAYIASRWLLRPIATLKHAVERYGQGEAPPAEVPRLPQDEIGALGRAFYAMANELERKRRQEHRLIEQLIHAQEEERKLVAYDLHDGLIQHLVGARFYMSRFRDAQGDATTPEMLGLQQSCDAISEAITEGRRIIEGLRPAVLDDLGLVAAIEEIAQTNARAAGWELELEMHSPAEQPEKVTAVTLYRIAQEALNNIRKHAQARRVRVHLKAEEGISLCIEDDGLGFDPEALHREERHGLGVTTMRERAGLLNGRCTIQSQPGSGTRVEAWVPLANFASAVAGD